MAEKRIKLEYKIDAASDEKVQLGPDDVLVAEFKTPVRDMAEGGAGGYVSIVEADALNWNRALCISETPGDFTANSVEYTKPNGNKKTTCTNYTEGFNPVIYFNKEPASGFDLKPNTVYFVNMKTLAASDNNCAVLITLQARD